MVDKGHDVSAWAFMTGIDMPCPTYTELPETDYDLIIINHGTSIGYSHFKGLTGTRVFTSHGPLHPLEKTVGGADFYAGVSEEVVMVQAEQGYMADVMRQPIDLNLFKDSDFDRKDKMLIMPKRTDVLQTAVSACKKAGLDYDIVHYRKNPIVDLWNVLPDYKYVMSAGRGALEAIACGCQVFSYNGDNHCDGWLDDVNLPKASQNNYSGRATHLSPSVDELADMLREIPKYDKSPCIEWVKTHHNADDIADKYLSYATRKQMSNTLHPIHKDENDARET